MQQLEIEMRERYHALADHLLTAVSPHGLLRHCLDVGDQRCLAGLLHLLEFGLLSCIIIEILLRSNLGRMRFLIFYILLKYHILHR